MAYQSKSEYLFLVDFVLLGLDITTLFVLHAAPPAPFIILWFFDLQTPCSYRATSIYRILLICLPIFILLCNKSKVHGGFKGGGINSKAGGTDYFKQYFLSNM